MSHMPPALDFRNTNALWCTVLVETLARCGLRCAVISPGSRSTPLTFALVRHAAIDAISVLDERSAAFFALGQAKRTHRPVALVCTSGTAGANYLPAVIEAHESGTPLLVLTADRPPELRDCASGQTIDQGKLFGAFVSFFHEFAVPEARLEMLRYARQTVAHAFQSCVQPHPGPVHLNMPFRDPLAPVEDASASALASELGENFFAHLRPPASLVGGSVVWQRPATTRGLVIAGPANPADESGYVAKTHALATSLGWPILADALSPLRHHAAPPGVPVIAHYDAILRSAEASRDLIPHAVVCLEGWPTSKALRAWLEEGDAEVTLVSDAASNRDALHGRTRHVPVAVDHLGVESPGVETGTATASSYRAAWEMAERAVEAVLRGELERTADLFEPKGVHVLGQVLPTGTPIFVASSMPVRDAEYFWPRTDRRTRFFFNRGANGIDGTLSTALGVAHGAGVPAVLFTGDLAFLHDSNGLLQSRRLRGSLTVVLINNHGGGIFEHLPVASFDPPFEEFFATPQQVDFAALCAAHGAEHVLVRDWEQFRSLVASLPAAGVRVLEVRTDRKSDARRRRELLRAAGAACDCK
jgi:2-succinyl-5-enolpyruvyl-6-hydroxy-3-cyclohexene-1-carboxylate synthase